MVRDAFPRDASREVGTLPRKVLYCYKGKTPTGAALAKQESDKKQHRKYIIQNRIRLRQALAD